MAERRAAVIESASRQHKEETEFPKDPEKRMAAILAAFNFGPKATTLLLLPVDSYIAPKDLTGAFKQLMAGTRMANVFDLTAHGYCHETLYPIGLVAREYTINNWGKEELVGFGLTEAGRRYGVAAACLILAFEQEHQFSLFEILGATQSNSGQGSRAPITRASILELLFHEQRSQREADICQTLGIGISLARLSLVSLKRAAVIDYQAMTPQTGQVQVEYAFRKLPIKVKQYLSGSTLTRAVATVCQQLAKDKVMISQANVFEKLPADLKKDRKEKSLRSQVNNILSDLARQGVLERSRFEGRVEQSLAVINQRGEAVVRELVEPLRKLAQDDPVTWTQVREEVIPAVMANLEGYAGNSARLYYPHSMSSRILESLANQAKVLELIGQEPGTTIQELATKTGLDERTIGNYLRAFLKSGQVEKEVVKGVGYWHLGVKSATRV